MDIHILIPSTDESSQTFPLEFRSLSIQLHLALTESRHDNNNVELSSFLQLCTSPEEADRLCQIIQTRWPSFWSSMQGRIILCEAFDHYIEHGHLPMLRWLFKLLQAYHESEFQTRLVTETLFDALHHHQEDVAMYLIDEGGADVCARDSSNRCKTMDDVQKEGNTVLEAAVTHGMLKIVKHLVRQKHVNPLFPRSSGHNAVCDAASSGYIDILKFFIKHQGNGIINNACQGHEKTLLQHASRKDEPDMLKWLIDHPAVNVKDSICSHGSTPLHAAARKGYEGNCQILMKYGKIPVNATTGCGCTALHAALMSESTCGYRKMKVVEALIEGGVDRSLRDEEGMTAAVIANQRGYTEIYEYLTVEDREVADAAMASLLAEEDEKKSGGAGGGSISSKPNKRKKKRMRKQAAAAAGEGGGVVLAAEGDNCDADEDDVKEIAALASTMAGGLSLKEKEEAKSGCEAQEGENGAAQEEAIPSVLEDEVAKVEHEEVVEDGEHEEEVEDREEEQDDDDDDDDDDEDFLLEGAPDELKCPISFKLMTDPVTAPDGRAYARDALQGYIDFAADHQIDLHSPMTGEPMAAAYFPAINIKNLVHDHIKKKRQERMKSV